MVGLLETDSTVIKDLFDIVMAGGRSVFSPSQPPQATLSSPRPFSAL